MTQPLPNPGTADVSGIIFFYANPASKYHLQISGTGLTPSDIPDISLPGAGGGGGGAVNSVFGRVGAVVSVSGDYTVSQVTGAAPLASPTFTGTVSISGIANGCAQFAAGAFTSTSTPCGAGGGTVSSVFGRTGAVVATSGDYAVGQVTGAAPLASPALTGTPSAPTATLSDNSTTLATTAFVKGQNYVLSVFGRTGAITGTSGDYSVGQVTGAAPLASPTFTGNPAAPTQTLSDNSTLLATTAFVKGQGYLTAAPVTSVFGRTGAVTAQTGDYAVAQVTGAAVDSLVVHLAGAETITGGKLFTANVVVQSGGNSNVVQMADSGINTANGTNNTAQLVSGTSLASNVCASGQYTPIWSTDISNAVSTSGIELLCDKDQINGYPSLNSTGQVPISEIVLNTAGCTGTSFFKGDGSGCGAGGSAPGFDTISTGTNVTATMTVGTGGTLTFTAGGVINATQMLGVTYPTNNVGTGGLGAADRVLITTAANSVSGRSMPNCNGTSFLQYDTSTHNPGCGSPAQGVPQVLLACSGTNGACPDTSAFTGTGSASILISYTLPANTLTSSKCGHAIVWFQHSTGSAGVAYSWNVGGTGARGSAPTGGTSTGSSSSTSVLNFLQAELYFCNTGTASANYLRVPQFQFGAAQGGGQVTNGTIDYTQNQQINFVFNVANTDAVLFNGGFINFP